jgi:hypothetical protein
MVKAQQASYHFLGIEPL